MCTTVIVFASLLADVIAKRWLMVLPLFMFGRCYCPVADVIATVYYSSCWQMLCLVADRMPTWVCMADVIAKVEELCQMCTTVIVFASLLADVIAKMADGIAIVYVWQMLLPSG